MIIINAEKIHDNEYKVTVKIFNRNHEFEQKDIIMTKEEYEEAIEDNNKLEDF